MTTSRHAINLARRLVRPWRILLNWRTACRATAALAVLYVVASVCGYADVRANASPVAHGWIGGDFVAFYVAGSQTLGGDAERLYDPARVHVLQEAATLGKVPDLYVPFRNPPVFAVLVAPFTTLDPVWSFAAWTAFSAVLLVVAVALTLGMVPRVRSHWRTTVVVVAGFAPVYFGLVDGQNATLSLLLYVLTYWALRRGHDGAAGFTSALGLFKPQLFFVMPVIFLTTRRWKALTVYSLTAATIALGSLALVGVQGLVAWAHVLVDFEGGNAAMFASRMYSLKAVFDLLLPSEPGAALALTSVASAVILLLLMRTWSLTRVRDHSLALRWALTVVVAVLVDPHLLDYDLTVLLLPGLLLVGEVRDARWWIAAIYILVVADAPLPLGGANLQVAVLLLAGFAVRLWWHLEHLEPSSPLPQHGLEEGAMMEAPVYATASAS